MAFVELPEKEKKVQHKRRGKRKEELARAYDAYRHVRRVYLASHPLCEKCLEQGIIRKSEEVHHKRHLLSAKTLSEMISIATDMENLEALCRDCHMAEHNKNVIDERFIVK